MNEEFDLTERDFRKLQDLVFDITGISLSDAKRTLVYRRFAPRIKSLNLNGFKEYCELIASGDKNEITHFSNAITTNLTAFFRENHHFEFLAKKALPLLKEKNSKTRQIRIWSAGCSTGEEPYSIAITLKENMPDLEAWDVKVLATDLDTGSLGKAKAGIYTEKILEKISKEQCRRWFLKGKQSNQDKIKVSPELQSLIHFQPLNLMTNWPFKNHFDLIFCRNVLIYFDKPTQKMLAEKFSSVQKVGGHLIIGHSESLQNVTPFYRLTGQTIYERTDHK